MSLEPHSDIHAYLDGVLTPAEVAVVEAHLETCDECLTLLDEIWGVRLTKISDIDTPDLPESAARAIETRLLNQIRRTDLSGQAIHLGTRGFFQVLLAMLRPFLSFTSPHKQQRSSQ